ncbi:hypothetical protein Tco_0593612 [Tanacetum coccineum]
MATTAAQQIALDNALVALEKQVEIGKCNMRIDPKMTPKEPTYQVVLDTLAHTTCYLTFLITTSVPEFDELPSEEEILSFIKDLSYTGNIKKITDVVVDQMYQPWRAFAAIINKCISRKITGLDKIRLSRAQILWGMYHKKNIDFVSLLWEDFAFQIDNRDFKKQEKMYYPRFTKAIINHFLSKDKTISMRNRMFMHNAQDDCILGNLRFVSKDKDTQVYGALIPAVMTNPMIWDFAAYQTYFAFATEEATPKPKRIYKKTASPTITKSPKETPSKKKTTPAKKDVSSNKPSRKQSTGVQIRDTPGVSVSKKKAPVTTDKSKGIELLSEATLLEDAQMKKALKKSKRDINIHQASGSRVLDVSKAYSSISENESWGDSGDDEESDDVSDDDGNDDDSDNDDGNNDSDDVRAESDDDKNDDDQEEEYVRTPENYESTDDEDEHVDEEEYEELYKDSYTAEFKKKAQAERKRYIDLVEKSVKDIINDEVKTQLSQILLKAISDFVTPMIKSTITESLEDVMEKSQSNLTADVHKELYKALVNSYNVDKDLFKVYGKAVSLKIGREDKDKDEDPPAGSDQGMKRWKKTKDVKPSTGLKSKESKSSSSKGTKSQSKSSDKFAQAEESVF